jgi:transposase, IS30 family
MPLPPRRTVFRAFWRAISEGSSIADAAAAVGVSESSGRTWLREPGGVKPAVTEPKTDGPRPG